MRRTIENPIRDWFYTLAGSILAAGMIGIIATPVPAVITYILEFLGFSSLVFGLVIIFQPNKEAVRVFVLCVLTSLILVLEQHYGLI